jgi:PKD repeat protein
MKKYIFLGFMCVVTFALCGSAAAADTPTAGFSANVTSGTAPLNVQFTDQSTGTPTSYSWDFGDGATSTEQNPKHTYKTSGAYTVTQTVTNDAGTDDEIKTDYITVKEKADLTVTSVSGPSTGVKGKQVSIDSTIKNQGGSTANNFIVRYLLSSDNKFGGDYWLGDVTINNLDAGASLTSTNTFTIPATATTYTSNVIPAGIYYVLCYIDRNNTVSETNEANNILSSTSKIGINLPDLTVTSVSGPVKGIKGKQISIDSTILNQGSATASNFNVRYLLSSDTKFGGDYWLGDVTINNLAAGASLTSTKTFIIPRAETLYTPRVLPDGLYYILCYIDRNNTVNESIETNNVLASTETINVTSVPDLTVTSVSGPSTGVRGEQISIDSTILNQGDAAASNFIVRYLLSSDTYFGGDYWLGDAIIDSLTNGTSLTSTNTFTIPTAATTYTPNVLPAGTYYILCYIDRYNTVTELSENNNLLATVGTITIT